MATYLELFPLNNTAQDLNQKVVVAITIKAQNILDDPTPTAAAVQWASNALLNPSSVQSLIFNYVVAVNNTASVNDIVTASDSDVQMNVDAAIDVIVGAL